MSQVNVSPWPVLRRYDQQHLLRIGLPIGGIGTGTVSLGGRGDLHDWELMNRPAKGFTPPHSFFALHMQPDGAPATTKALEGALDVSDYEGARGATVPNHNLPRFRNCSFEAAYPLGQVLLSDPNVPLDVRFQAFNPLIPGDTDRSSIPVAVLRFVLHNKTSRRVCASVCGNVQNFIGFDGADGEARGNINEHRTAEGPQSLRGIFMHTTGIAPQAEQWGTMALTSICPNETTYRTAWPKRNWGGSLLDFWDDFSSDGKLKEYASTEASILVASLTNSVEIPPHEDRSITYLLSWYFPNRKTWTPVCETGSTDCCSMDSCCESVPDVNHIGNYYATRYTDAWDVAVRTANELATLERDTVKFVDAFCGSDFPDEVKEAALFNISTLRTQTSFRTEDGLFYGWEGCDDTSGCCYGSCTHVWNYEQATPFLFGDLACLMRKVEFLHTTNEQGLMSFRVNLPIDKAEDFNLAAADGQMGCLMKLHRDWQLSGDDAMLQELWPRARKALEFCWIEGGWDADRDGVMEGCQHNTMDVEYYGPNPQMESWYLGALRAVEEMARYLGDDEFAATCQRLFEQGKQWTDHNLFNGEYYEHEIRPVQSEAAIANGLRHESMGARSLSDPELQLGKGCLVDQLVGQYMAHVCGLGYLLDKGHISSTLSSLMAYNFKENLYDHFNYMRSYALGDESAMLMATYPKGHRPQRPFPYSNEAMTGFEYTAAIHMLYEGRIDEGLKVMRAIRSRYDGRKRNPFDEAECGHHYARVMASWAAILALSGFAWSAVSGTMTFSLYEGTYFWSNGTAWGTCQQEASELVVDVTLHVLFGSLDLETFVLKGVGWSKVSRSVSAGSIVRLELKRRQIQA